MGKAVIATQHKINSGFCLARQNPTKKPDKQGWLFPPSQAAKQKVRHPNIFKKV